MRKITLVFFTATTLFSCSNSETKIENHREINTPITGVISNIGANKIVLERLTPTNVQLIDTLLINEKGEFTSGVNIEEGGFFRLKLTDQNFAVLIASPKEKINITADATNLGATFQVSGSEETTRLKQLNNFFNKIYVTGDSLSKAIRTHQTNRDINSYSQAVQFQNTLVAKMGNYIKAFIDESPASLASLAAVEKLNKEQYMDTYIKVADAMKAKIPNSEYYKAFQLRLNELNKLAIGSEAPDISLTTPEGTTLALSSLRGKIVLVDFWASWCKPCRAENPNVVKMYNKYKNKGFDVLGVSLDKAKNSWTQAITQDGLIWNHISDLGYWNSSVVKLYGITGIPLTYLIDKEGKILAKDLRGPALEAKLKELFGT